MKASSLKVSQWGIVLFVFFIRSVAQAEYYSSSTTSYLGPGNGYLYESQTGPTGAAVCKQFVDHLAADPYHHPEIKAYLNPDGDYDGTYRQILNYTYSETTRLCSGEFIWHRFYLGVHNDSASHTYPSLNFNQQVGLVPDDQQDPDKDSGEPAPCSSAGNPINLTSRNKYQKEIDYAGTASSIGSLSFERVYNSKLVNSYTGVFGTHWRSNFDRYLSFYQDATDPELSSIVILRRPDGKILYYNFLWDRWDSGADIRDKFETTATGYRFTSTSDIQELYDSLGNLTAIIYPNGYTQTLTYTNNQLTQVDDSLGKSLVFTYYGSGLIEMLTTSDSRSWTYRYDANNNLEYVDNPDDTTRQYHYEHTSVSTALTGITDERNIRYSTYTYLDGYSANSSTHSNNIDRVDLVNDFYNTMMTVTNSRGFDTTYTKNVQFNSALIAGISRPIAGDTGSSFEYDPNNSNLLSKTINGQITEYGSYNTNSNYGYRIKASGTPEQRRTDYTYDPRFFSKADTVTEPSVYTGSNKVTTYAYDDFGNTTHRFRSMVTDLMVPPSAALPPCSTMAHSPN